MTGESEQRRLAATQRAIFDALPAHVALVDARGVILEVNDAWRRFAAANALIGDACGVGVDYLAICDGASGECADEAAAAAAGLRGVLRGEQPYFTLEYPCHSPAEKRWFRLMVTPLQPGSVEGAVVMHVDVTERKLAEEALRDSERRYRLLFDHHPQPMWVFDLESLRFLAVNEAAVKTYGYSREQFLAMTIAEIRPTEDVAALRESVADAGVATLRASIWRHRRADGETFRVEVSSHPVEFAGRAARMVMAIDVTARLAAEEALRESEHELRRLAWQLDVERLRLVDAQAVAKVGSWETDLMSLAVTWSAETHRIFETDPAVLRPTHERFLELVHPDDRAAVDAAFAESLATRELRTIEHRLRLPDGRVKYVEERWQTFVDDDGRPVRALGTCQDITERRAAEEALRTSNERFRLLARATNDAIWDWDLLTDALWWNEGFETLFGYSRDEVEPTIDSWKNRVHPDDRARVVADVERAIAAGAEFWSGEYRYRHKDGHWLYVLDRGHVIRDVSGMRVRMIGGMTDLTERRRIEERLAEQAALLDAANEAILVKDLDDRVIYWNRGAERTYGRSAEQALGRRLGDLLERDATAYGAAREALMRDGQWRGELRHRMPEGGERVVDVSWTLVRDALGAPRAVLSINTDVTDKKNLEAQLLRAQRLESIGTLAGGIAHDLNNVLAPILMSIELMKEGESRPDRLELLTTIEASAQRGADMVHRVLSFARGVEGTKARIDLRTVVRDAAKIVRDTFPKSVTLELRLADDLWRVSADATQMHQVLMNLCVNSRDAMPDGGFLTITVENVAIDETYASMNPESRPGPYVRLKVADTGVGIPPEHQERLFEPFFTTKEVGRGTGLGLPMVHTIVRGHGGFINVYSEPGKGAKFRVYLPAATASEEAERVVAERQELPLGRGECVLVVDDEESIRSVTQRTLERFGYRVLLAANGAEAVSLYSQRREEIDVVLTDMSMPIMDGATTIVALQSIDPGVRIVASSGLAVNAPLSKELGAGVRRFVPKPYTAETLLRALRQALSDEA
ncbi:MAG: PAS domain S-box protein [Thermoanaerobaculia bacterium]|nr:PAS domain S-box protein [Thermoanaerobaculia bacterium]